MTDRSIHTSPHFPMPASRIGGTVCVLVILLLAPSASVLRASAHEQDPSYGEDRIERVGALPIAAGIRIFEVPLGLERVAERRTEFGNDAPYDVLGPGCLNPRLEDDLHGRTGDTEGRPARYHLHRALLI